MQRKQLYASIELAQDEIRLLVAEYYMARFTILRADKEELSQPASVMMQEKPQILKASISKLIERAQTALSLKIKKVILCIPSVKAKCVKRKISLPIEDGSGKIKMSDIRKGLDKAIDYGLSDELEFVNVGAIRYIVAGISSRIVPLDEHADSLSIEADLIYADKQVVYDYVRLIEGSGVDVLDICLDEYAIAEESAILENSMEKLIVLCDLQRYDTVISLFYNSRLMQTEHLHHGYQIWIDDIHRKHGLSYTESEAMVLENCFEERGLYDDMIAYVWMDRERMRQLSKMQIYDTVAKSANEWIAEVNEVCQPLTDYEKTGFVLSGKGSEIVGIQSLVDRIALPSEIYYNTTIGAREGKYTACLGAMYCVKKWQEVRNKKDVSIEYDNLIAREVRREDESGFTQKLKNILQVK